jgi:hypothetical protein
LRLQLFPLFLIFFSLLILAPSQHTLIIQKTRITIQYKQEQEQEQKLKLKQKQKVNEIRNKNKNKIMATALIAATKT